MNITMITPTKISNDDWRTRMLIRVNAILEPGSFPFVNAKIRVLNHGENDSCEYIIECYLQNKLFPNIKEAFEYSLDRLSEFLGRISIIINAPIEATKVLSICPTLVPARELFEMLIPADFSSDVAPVTIKHVDLEGFVKINDNINYLEAVRQASNALNSDSFEEKFLLYFSAFERIAEVDSSEKLYSECPNCGHKVERGIATTNYIKRKMLEYGVSNKDFNTIRSIRGKIAHGSGKRDSKFVTEAKTLLAKLESVLLAEISRKTGVTIKAPFKALFAMPVYACQGIKLSVAIGDIPAIFGLEKYTFSIPLSFSKLATDNIDLPEGMLGTFGPTGSLSKPFIHRECWPY
jgi:hypothetical protein